MKAKTDPLIGQLIGGRFQVQNRIGEGGMGVVYLAQQLGLDRLVAIKVLHEQYARDEEYVRRFRREAQEAARIKSDRVVIIYDFDDTLESGSLYIAMEYVAGRTLKEIIQQEGPLSTAQMVAWGVQIAEALQVVHQAGIIHRDIKPDNLMVQEKDGKIKLTDFGIARPRDRTKTGITHTGLLVGTLEYMAPELFDSGEFSVQSDIYALGIVLYEMLSGEVPFTGSLATLVRKHLQEKPRPLRELRREVPAQVERVVMQALEKRPDKRQRDMAEVIAQLRIPGTIIGPPPGLGDPKPRRSWPMWLAAVLSLIVVSAAGVWFMTRRENGPNGGAVVGPEESGGGESAVGESAEGEDPPLGAADYLHVGNFYLDRGQYAEAIKEFEAAQASDPENQEVLRKLQDARSALEAESRILQGR
jgi:serine/threonine protein kinase